MTAQLTIELGYFEAVACILAVFALGTLALWVAQWVARKRPVTPTPEQRALMADHRNTVRGAIHDSYTAGYLAGKGNKQPHL